MALEIRRGINRSMDYRFAGASMESFVVHGDLVAMGWMEP